MADFTIKQGDLFPLLIAILRDLNKDPVDLTASIAVGFHMKEATAGVLKIDDGACAKNVDPTTGEVTYTWASGDTDTAGSYLGEFEVLWPNSKTQTFPSKGYVTIDIEPDISDPSP